jgi:superfamily II DNA or RNA helicase
MPRNTLSDFEQYNQMAALQEPAESSVEDPTPIGADTPITGNNPAHKSTKGKDKVEPSKKFLPFKNIPGEVKEYIKGTSTQIEKESRRYFLTEILKYDFNSTKALAFITKGVDLSRFKRLVKSLVENGNINLAKVGPDLLRSMIAIRCVPFKKFDFVIELMKEKKIILTSEAIDELIMTSEEALTEAGDRQMAHRLLIEVRDKKFFEQEQSSQQTIPKAEVSTAASQKKSQFIQGINSKYLGLPVLPSLPQQNNAGFKQIQHDRKYCFVRMSDLGAKTREKGKTKISNIQSPLADFHSADPNDHYKVDLAFYSSRPAVKREIITFVFAGRGENALFPRPSANSRVILVATPEEYETYSDKVPDDIDILVINSILSKTNGDYDQDSRRSINVRRLAAFIFSERCALQYCLFLDDNIEYLPYKSHILPHANGEIQFEDIYRFLLAERAKYNNPIILGAANISTVMKTDFGGTFCAKLHFWDLKALRDKGLTGNRLCYLKYNADNVFCWGGDYFFHYFLLELYAKDSESKKIFATIDPQDLGYVRSVNDKHAFKLSAIKSKDLLEIDIGAVATNIYSEAESIYIEARQLAAEALKNSIRYNLKVYNSRLAKLQNVDMLREHARANLIPYVEPVSVSSAAGASYSHYRYYERLRYNVESFADRVLMPHQIKALNSIYMRQRECGSLIMATGSGKTRVQMFLACTAMQLMASRPIVIVVPTQNLVEQCYEDFKEFIDLFNQHAEIKVDKGHVIKLMSGAINVNPILFKINNKIKGQNFIAICCLNSYKLLTKIKTSEASEEDQGYGEELEPELQMQGLIENEILSTASLTLMDEYHLYTKVLNGIEANPNAIKNGLIYGLTATPKKNDLFKDRPLFDYNAAQALHDRVIIPAKLERLQHDYSKDLIESQEFKEEILEFMSTHVHPNGEPLIAHKAIIYLPSIKTIKDYVEYFRAQGVECFEIHSHNAKASMDLEAFRVQKSKGIAFVYQMIGVGYSDRCVDTILYLRNANEDSAVTQALGRALRFNHEQPNKRSLLVGFKDIKHDGIFDLLQASEANPIMQSTQMYDYQAAHNAHNKDSTQKKMRMSL